HLRILAQAEGQRQIALRRIARPAADRVALLAACALHPDCGPDAVAIGFAADGAYTDPVVAIAAIVAIEVRRALVGSHEQVQVAVVIDIGVSGPAGDNRPIERRAHRWRGILELALAEITEKQRRLPVLNLRLDLTDLLFDVAVGAEDVEIAVE